MKVWVGDGLVDAEAASVSVFDHGLTVGDGVFETAKVVDGQPYALSRHLARLARSAAGLGLEVPWADEVRVAANEVLAANDTSVPLRLRITVTGGPSPLGSERGDRGPTLIVAVAPLKTWGANAALATVPWPRNERAATAGLKTTSYADNVVALAHAHRLGADEALFLNTRGEICEGTGSNVFLVVDGELVTPPLSSGCLQGVTRDLVVEWCGAAQHDLPADALVDATEVFITSSTRDVMPVRDVDGRPYPAPGPVTRRVMATWAERSAADVDP